MIRVALVALAGCNSIFGIERTKALPHADAQQFDGQPDAPFACPPTGSAPRFSVYFKQVVPQRDCEHYTVGGGIAVATCAVPAGVELEQGNADAAALSAVTPAGLIEAALSPDGTELWQLHGDTANQAVLSVYAPDTMPDSWQLLYDAQTFTAAGFGVASTPMAQGSPRRVLLSIGGSVHELDEMSPHVWTDTILPPLLPTGNMTSPPQLSPDGLRVVFAGNGVPGAGVYYADRASLSAPFNPAVLLTGPPQMAFTPFMTADCSRIYFSGLGSVFYVPEELP